MKIDLQLFGGGGETTTDRNIPDQTPQEKELEKLLLSAAEGRLDFSNGELFNRFKGSLGGVIDNLDWQGLLNQANGTNQDIARQYYDFAGQLGNYVQNRDNETNDVYAANMVNAWNKNNQAQSDYANAQADNDTKYRDGMAYSVGKYNNALANADQEYRDNQYSAMADWAKSSWENLQNWQETGAKNLDEWKTDSSRALNDYNNKTSGYLNDYTGKMSNALGQYQTKMGEMDSRWTDLTNGILPESFATHRQAALNADLEGTVGNAFNNLANRGIINSAVTNKSMDDISQNASDTLAKMWTSDLNTEADLLRGRQTGVQGIYDTTSSNAGNVFNNQNITANSQYGNTTNYYNTRYNNAQDLNDKNFANYQSDADKFLNYRTDYNNALLGNANANANSIYSNEANAWGSIHDNQANTASNNWSAANTVFGNTDSVNQTWANNRNAQTQNQGNLWSGLAQNNFNNTTNAAQNTLANSQVAQTSSFNAPTQYQSYMDASYNPASNMYNTMYSGRMGTGSTTTSQNDGGAGMFSALGTVGAAIAICFAGDTLVTVPDGYKYIRDIREGDYVLSMENREIVPKKVVKVNEPHEAVIYEVRFDDGTRWRTTETQRCFDGQHFHKCFCGSRAIDTDLMPCTVDYIINTGVKETVYDFAVEGFAGENVFFANDVAAEGFGD